MKAPKPLRKRLKVLTAMIALPLGQNGIGDRGVVALVKAVERSQRFIACPELADNNIGRAGEMAIIKAHKNGWIDCKMPKERF